MAFSVTWDDGSNVSLTQALGGQSQQVIDREIIDVMHVRSVKHEAEVSCP